MVLVLGLAFVLASIEDRSDRLLSRGMVSGDVEQVTGGMGLQGAKFVVGLQTERRKMGVQEVRSDSGLKGRE